MEEFVEVNLNESTSATNPPPLRSTKRIRFQSLVKETEDERELREMKELAINGEGHNIYAIPYEYIGNNSKQLYPGIDMAQYQRNYPDYYKLTPAYNMNFSGMTKTEQFTTLFKPSSSNNVFQRLKRLANEDKTVIYCDWWDKAASTISFIFIVLMLIITYTQLKTRASVTYETKDIRYKEEVDKLNAWATSDTFSYIKLALSIISATIVIRNVFKRTTLPRKNTRITSFRNGTVELPTGRRETMASTTKPQLSRGQSLRNIFSSVFKSNKVAPAPTSVKVSTVPRSLDVNTLIAFQNSQSSSREEANPASI